MAFPKYILIYLFGKPIASSYPLGLRCMIAWILKFSRIFVSMAFNLTLCHMLICCEVGLEYHSDTTEKYCYSTCPWQVRLIIVMELVDHLHDWFLLWIALFYYQGFALIKLSFVFLVSFGSFCSTQNFLSVSLRWEKQWPHFCAF